MTLKKKTCASRVGKQEKEKSEIRRLLSIPTKVLGFGVQPIYLSAPSWRVPPPKIFGWDLW